MMEPRIQYAKTSDGVSIAFATTGEGSLPAVREQEPLARAQLSHGHRRKELAALGLRCDARGEDDRRPKQIAFFFDRLAGVEADADGNRFCRRTNVSTRSW